MKHLTLILLLLLAAPAFASTTTATVLVFDALRVDCQFQFYTGELKDRFNQPLGGLTPQQKCDSLIDAVDAGRLEQEHGNFISQLPDNPNPELLQPLYPEDCVTTAANHPAVTVEDCRRSVFHQAALQFVWKEEGGIEEENSLAFYMEYVYVLIEWITGNGPGTSGYSTNEEQAWLAGIETEITTAQRGNLRARNSNAGGAVATFETDENNWQHCPYLEQDQAPGTPGCQP